MSTVSYYSEQAVATLHRNVEKALEWYYAPGDSPLPAAEVQNPVRLSNLTYESLRDRLTSDRASSTDDAENALLVYRSLKTLTRQQAADERLWTYLCHTECATYVAARWLAAHRASDKDDEARARRVRNHFFASGNRALIRDNALSRLWWLGCIAERVDPQDPRRFLDILLNRQDVRSALIERPAISMNHDVLRAIYTVMREKWEAEGEKAVLFQRKKFRQWMINLNRRGGVILLDALDQATLDKLLRDEAQAAIESNGP